MTGNPYHDPKTGEFTFGPGGGGAGGSSGGGSRIEQAVKWIKSGDARKAIAAAVTGERVKEAVAFGVQTLVEQVSNVNDPNIDAVVQVQIMNIGMTARLAVEKMNAGVNKMIELRTAQVRGRNDLSRLSAVARMNAARGVDL